MGRDAREYLDKHREEMPEDWYNAFQGFIEANEFDLADRTLYDYVSRMRSILNQFAPEGFKLSEPTQEQIKNIARQIRDSDDISDDTRESYYKTLKKFYGTFEDGEYYDFTDCFSVSGSNAKVEKHMILSEAEVSEIINQTNNMRNKAFFRLMYEVAATPGELLQARLQDIDLEQETMYVRGNKTHRSQTMELHNEGLQYLRSYLKSHPSVDDPFTTVSDEPLWIKMREYSCTNCGKSESAHDREEEEVCENYEPEEVEEVGYRSFYKAFKQAVEKSSIERNVKPKYFRKSMLTRLCAEGIGYEQLNNFARWQPGSNQAAHYVSLSNDKLREWVRDKFKEGSGEGSKIIECHNCGSRNSADRLECKKCHRPLNAPKSEKMKKAKEIADRLSQFDDEKLDRIEQNIEILENPQELIREEVERIVGEQS